MVRVGLDVGKKYEPGQTDQTLEAALRFAFEHIKASDVVCVGMWQKYKDQVAQDVALVNNILKTQRAE